MRPGEANPLCVRDVLWYHREQMAKKANRLAAALFIWALVFAPAIHRVAGPAGEPCASWATCAHESQHGHADPHPGGRQPEPHDAEHCAICQLAAMPMLAFVPAVILVSDSVPAPIPEFTFDAPAVPVARRLPFACGPPA
jgi:hypothetical protein